MTFRIGASRQEDGHAPRRILLGGAQAGTTSADSLAAVYNSTPANRPTSSRWYPMTGRRIHFAGADAAVKSWGQEAALESGNRTAMEIDRA